MPWYKIIDGIMVKGSTVNGPGYDLVESPGPPTDGWQYFGNNIAAYAALSYVPKVMGPDRAILDQAIDGVESVEIRDALIVIRDNDPTPPSLMAAIKTRVL